MKLTVKTTQQKVFQIEAEPSDTVEGLKNKIQQSQGFDAAAQKIIYSGKILPNDKTVEALQIKDKDFLVLMVSKPKPTPSTPTAASSSTPITPVPATTPPQAAPAAAAAPQDPTTTPAASVTPAPTTPAPAQPAQERAFGDTSSFVSGTALQETINNMVDMGFPREHVLRALRASFNNPDRAVEYLMNGIPEHLEAELAAPPAGAAQAAAPAAGGNAPLAAQAGAPAAAAGPGPQNLFQLAQQQQQGGGPAPRVPPGVQGLTGAGAAAAGLGAGAPGGMPDLSALQNNPQIAQLRQLIRSNPALIQPLIQQLAQANPGLAQAFAQNPQALAQILGINDLPDLGDIQMGEGGEDGDIPPGATVLNVTEEERDAIQRLEALGFPRHAVIEAYFACDKNEELAANYLFESQFEE